MKEIDKELYRSTGDVEYLHKDLEKSDSYESYQENNIGFRDIIKHLFRSIFNMFKSKKK